MTGVVASLSAVAWGLGVLGYWHWARFGFSPEAFLALVRVLGEADARLVAYAAPRVLTAALIFAAALSLGRLLLRTIFRGADRAPLGPFLAFGLGLGALSHLLLALGLSGLWRPSAFAGLLTASLAAGLWADRDIVLAWARRPRGPSAPASGGPATAEAFGLLLLGAFLLVNLLAALGPEFEYDSLLYHLALPQQYLAHGRIVPTPHMIYSGIPFGMEMLFGLGLGLGDEAVAKLISWGFGALLTALVYAWTKKEAGPRAALLGALLFYSAPLVCFQGWVSMVDMGLAFFTTLALFASLEAGQEAEAGASRTWVALAGVFCGLALSVKYNAAPTLAAGLIPFLFLRRAGWRSAARSAALFWAAALLVAAPWLLKNLAFFGNPVYPFLGGVFRSSPPGLDMRGFLAEAQPGALLDRLTGLWSLGQTSDGYMGAATLVAAPWLLLAPRAERRQRALAWTVLALWAAWTLVSRLPRYFLPALPVFCAAAACGWARARVPAWSRGALAALAACGFLVNLTGVAASWYEQGLWAVPLGLTTKAAYLARRHPAYGLSYHAAAEFINEKTPAESVVLFIGEERTYYCRRRAIAASVFDRNPILDLADASADGGELAARLRGLGATHLLLNRAAARYQALTGRFTPRGLRAYEDLGLRHARLVFEDKREAQDGPSWTQVFALAD